MRTTALIAVLSLGLASPLLAQGNGPAPVRIWTPLSETSPVLGEVSAPAGQNLPMEAAAEYAISIPRASDMEGGWVILIPHVSKVDSVHPFLNPLSLAGPSATAQIETMISRIRNLLPPATSGISIGVNAPSTALEVLPNHVDSLLENFLTAHNNVRQWGQPLRTDADDRAYWEAYFPDWAGTMWLEIWARIFVRPIATSPSSVHLLNAQRMVEASILLQTLFDPGAVNYLTSPAFVSDLESGFDLTLQPIQIRTMDIASIPASAIAAAPAIGSGIIFNPPAPHSNPIRIDLNQPLRIRVKLSRSGDNPNPYLVVPVGLFAQGLGYQILTVGLPPQITHAIYALATGVNSAPVPIYPFGSPTNGLKLVFPPDNSIGLPQGFVYENGIDVNTFRIRSAPGPSPLIQ